jgi:transcriptional regulator with XRE-family HTH domain
MFNNLRAEMVRQKLTNKDIADVLNIDVATVSAKLNNYGRLKYHEAEKIRNAFFPELDFSYLFKYENGANRTTH